MQEHLVNLLHQRFKSRKVFQVRGHLFDFFPQFFEEHADMAGARERERQLKGKARAKKNKIVESVNPSWCDLSSEIT